MANITTIYKEDDEIYVELDDGDSYILTQDDIINLIVDYEREGEY